MKIHQLSLQININEWHIWQKIGFEIIRVCLKIGNADDPDDPLETGFGFQL